MRYFSIHISVICHAVSLHAKRLTYPKLKKSSSNLRQKLSSCWSNSSSNNRLSSSKDSSHKDLEATKITRGLLIFRTKVNRIMCIEDQTIKEVMSICKTWSRQTFNLIIFNVVLPIIEHHILRISRMNPTNAKLASVITETSKSQKQSKDTTDKALTIKTSLNKETTKTHAKTLKTTKTSNQSTSLK